MCAELFEYFLYYSVVKHLFFTNRPQSSTALVTSGHIFFYFGSHPTHQSLQLKGAIFSRQWEKFLASQFLNRQQINHGAFKLEKRLTRREVFIYLLIICERNLRDCSSDVRLIQIACKERSTPRLYKPQMCSLSGREVSPRPPPNFLFPTWSSCITNTERASTNGQQHCHAC
jgi:hypothetical protein